MDERSWVAPGFNPVGNFKNFFITNDETDKKTTKKKLTK